MRSRFCCFANAAKSPASSPGRSGTIRPGEPSIARSPHEIFGAAAENDGVRTPSPPAAESMATVLSQSRSASKMSPDVQPAGQGPRVRRLNDGSVGDGVAVGKADFDQVDAALGERANDRQRRLHVRIAARHEGHEGHVPFRFQCGERCFNPASQEQHSHRSIACGRH